MCTPAEISCCRLSVHVRWYAGIGTISHGTTFTATSIYEIGKQSSRSAERSKNDRVFHVLSNKSPSLEMRLRKDAGR